MDHCESFPIVGSSLIISTLKNEEWVWGVCEWRKGMGEESFER